MSHLKPDRDDYYGPPGTCHYNVCFKAGHMLSRVRQRDLCELREKDIEWIWIVEEMRHATLDEVCQLCGGK